MTTKFTVYELATGRIIRSGYVLGTSVAEQVVPGEAAAVLEGVEGNWATECVDVLANPPVVVAKPAPTLAEQKTAAKARLAERRWAVETGGLTVAGAQIATDRESQAMLSGALNYCALNPTAAIQWKAEGGFVTVDAATIRQIALTVGRHIQACFSREAALSAAIDAADAEQLAAVLAEVEAFDLT